MTPPRPRPERTHHSFKSLRYCLGIAAALAIRVAPIGSSEAAAPEPPPASIPISKKAPQLRNGPPALPVLSADQPSRISTTPSTPAQTPANSTKVSSIQNPLFSFFDSISPQTSTADFSETSTDLPSLLSDLEGIPSEESYRSLSRLISPALDAHPSGPSFRSDRTALNSQQNSILPSGLDPISNVPAPLLSETIRNNLWLSPVLNPPNSTLPGHLDWAKGQEAVTSASLAQTQAPFDFHWGLRSALVADSNPQLATSASNPSKKHAMRLELGPQARVQLGRQESELLIGALYAGAYTRNFNQPYLPFFQHNAALDGRWLRENLQLGFRGAFNSQQSGNRDTTTRATEHTLSGRFQAGYRVTEKISTEATLDATRSELGESLLGSEEERLRLFIDYALGAKLQLGLGGGLGELRPASRENQKYNQALLRAKYTPSEKLSLNVAAGAENRRLRGTGNTASNPVFNLGGLWSASPKAAVTLDAERRSVASALEDSTHFESTRIKLGWIEQLTPTLQSQISVGYERALYSGPIATRTSRRKDDYWMGRAEIQWALRSHSTVGLFVESNTNHSSSENDFSFRRHQLGLSLNLHF